MIELMFPQTVSNILDYDGIKAAAKKYVEDVFVQITESFGNNLVLQSMDEGHLAEVARHVTGNPETTLEELLDYINTDNTYHEFEFVNELTTAFPEGVEYKAFEVTGWQFPNADFPPFNEQNRSRRYDGTPTIAEDEVWDENSSNGEGVRNLMMTRFRGQFKSVDGTPTWHKKSGRRASWGNEETWMTTGGFGKPSTIHINVDEARTVIEKNGLSSVENWLGTVSNKLPINLYIEINDQLRTSDSEDDVAGLAGSTEGYPMAFPYEEEEGFCTNDPDWPGPEPEPEPALPTVSYIDLSTSTTGTPYTIQPNGVFTPYLDGTTNTVLYDSSCSYAVRRWNSTNGGTYYYTPVFEVYNTIPSVGIKNISGSAVTVFLLNAAVCSSPDATVITVYDSSNNPYNAFQYTSDGTDYYYVLDGTQTDWTDDLSSIGYHLAEYLDLIVGIVYSDGAWLSRTFGANDYWYSGILSNDDKLRLEAFGLGATEPGGSFGPIGNVFYNGGLFEYEVKALYSDLGSTEIITNISNFFVRAGGSFSTSVFINSINAFSTPVMSWKLRVNKKQSHRAYANTNKVTYIINQ